jgi:hypothetical protein
MIVNLFKSKAMKKIFTLPVLLVIASVVFLSSCFRDNTFIDNNESYWLSQERGEVVYSDSYCNYYVVETFDGYTIVRSYGGYKPFEGAIVYGNFSNRGNREMYNYSSGYTFTGTVTDYWLTYYEAQNALDYYCPLIGGKGTKREFKSSTFNNKK